MGEKSGRVHQDKNVPLQDKSSIFVMFTGKQFTPDGKIELCTWNLSQQPQTCEAKFTAVLSFPVVDCQWTEWVTGVEAESQGGGGKILTRVMFSIHEHNVVERQLFSAFDMNGTGWSLDLGGILLI